MKRFVWLLVRYTSQAIDRALGAFVAAMDARDARSSERDF